MKVEIFIRSFGGPILLAILLVIGILNGLTPFQTFIQTTFVISFLLLKLLGDAKFAYKVAINENKLLVSFYTSFLNIKTEEFEVSDIKDAKLTRRSLVSVIWLPNLVINYNNERHTFNILTKEMYAEIQLLLKNENILLI